MGKDLESNVIQRKRIVERKNMEGKSVVRCTRQVFRIGDA